jgi:hypothetical protein
MLQNTVQLKQFETFMQLSGRCVVWSPKGTPVFLVNPTPLIPSPSKPLQITAANVAIRGIIICRGGEVEETDATTGASPSNAGNDVAPATAPVALHELSLAGLACVEVHGAGFALEM